MDLRDDARGRAVDPDFFSGMIMRRWSIIIGLAVVAAAAAGGLWLHNRRDEAEIRSQLYIPKQSHITPEITLLQRYVRIDTSNPPGREIEGARFLAGLLEKNGIKAEIIEPVPGRANLYARLKGKR